MACRKRQTSLAVLAEQECYIVPRDKDNGYLTTVRHTTRYSPIRSREIQSNQKFDMDLLISFIITALLIALIWIVMPVSFAGAVWIADVFIIIVFTVGYFFRWKILEWLIPWEWYLELKFKLDSKKYTVLHDIYLPTKENETTQIDYLVVSQWGIFVIEAKAFRHCSIYGTPDEAQWTFVYSRRQKFKKQNPLRQNYKHICTLAECLNRPHEEFENVVVFGSSCEFKTQMPNVLHFEDLIKYILSHSRETIIPLEQVQEVADQIRAWQKAVPDSQKENHVKNLHKRHDANGQKLPRVVAEQPMQGEPPMCTRCGIPMVLRSNKKTGEQFWGCKNFPKCYEIRKLENSSSVASLPLQDIPQEFVAPPEPRSAPTVPAADIHEPEMPVQLSQMAGSGALGDQLAKELDNFNYRVLPAPFVARTEYEKSSCYLVLSPGGVFVILHLLFNGKIYGEKSQNLWKSRYGLKKYLFQNPLQYGSNRIAELSTQLHLPPQAFHNIIVFNDGATFRQEMPEGVVLFSETANYLRNRSHERRFTLEQLDTIQAQINQIYRSLN